MAEEHAAHGIKGLLGKDTAGLPNWVWLVVIISGIGVAYILPKLLGSGKSNSSQDQSNNPQDQSGTSQASGLGLAIDPTTGLPYAVEGLVPGGGTTGATATQATPDMTATNNLLQQLLTQLQGQKPTPVPVHHPKKTPTTTPTPPTHKKTTSTATVTTSAFVPTSPVPRPKVASQPTVPVASPTPARHKLNPAATLTAAAGPHQQVQQQIRRAPPVSQPNPFRYNPRLPTSTVQQWVTTRGSTTLDYVTSQNGHVVGRAPVPRTII